MWKSRNKIVFQHQTPSDEFSLADKIEVFQDTWFQICNQQAKLDIEQAHMKTLLNDWKNAPCSVSRVFPNNAQQTSWSRSRFHQVPHLVHARGGWGHDSFTYSAGRNAQPIHSPSCSLPRGTGDELVEVNGGTQDCAWNTGVLSALNCQLDRS